MYIEDLKVGDERFTNPVVVDEEEMLSFARRYNPHPVHADPEYAATTRFKKPIAAGVMTYLLVWAQYSMDDFAGQQLVGGKELKIQWHAPVFAGDTLTGRAYVAAIEEHNRYNSLVRIALEVKNQDGTVVLTSETASYIKKR